MNLDFLFSFSCLGGGERCASGEKGCRRFCSRPPIHIAWFMAMLHRRAPARVFYSWSVLRVEDVYFTIPGKHFRNNKQITSSDDIEEEITRLRDCEIDRVFWISYLQRQRYVKYRKTGV
jgi:hypothetical protein